MKVIYRLSVQKNLRLKNYGKFLAHQNKNGSKKDDVKTAIATQNDWYVMDNFAGTSLEEALIQFISERLGDLKSKYDVHLIRNEEVFKLNNFADGEGFMPDFILLLKDKQKSSSNGVNDFFALPNFH